MTMMINSNIQGNTSYGGNDDSRGFGLVKYDDTISDESEEEIRVRSNVMWTNCVMS